MTRGWSRKLLDRQAYAPVGAGGAGATGLTVVSHDNTMLGDGTPSNPLTALGNVTWNANATPNFIDFYAHISPAYQTAIINGGVVQVDLEGTGHRISSAANTQYLDRFKFINNPATTRKIISVSTGFVLPKLPSYLQNVYLQAGSATASMFVLTGGQHFLTLDDSSLDTFNLYSILVTGGAELTINMFSGSEIIGVGSIDAIKIDNGSIVNVYNNSSSVFTDVFAGFNGGGVLNMYYSADSKETGRYINLYFYGGSLNKSAMFKENVVSIPWDISQYRKFSDFYNAYGLGVTGANYQVVLVQKGGAGFVIDSNGSTYENMGNVSFKGAFIKTQIDIESGVVFIDGFPSWENCTVVLRSNSTIFDNNSGDREFHLKNCIFMCAVSIPIKVSAGTLSVYCDSSFIQNNGSFVFDVLASAFLKITLYNRSDLGGYAIQDTTDSAIGVYNDDTSGVGYQDTVTRVWVNPTSYTSKQFYDTVIDVTESESYLPNSTYSPTGVYNVPYKFMNNNAFCTKLLVSDPQGIGIKIVGDSGFVYGSEFYLKPHSFIDIIYNETSNNWTVLNEVVQKTFGKELVDNFSTPTLTAFTPTFIGTSTAEYNDVFQGGSLKLTTGDLNQNGVVLKVGDSKCARIDNWSEFILSFYIETSTNDEWSLKFGFSDFETVDEAYAYIHINGFSGGQYTTLEATGTTPSYGTFTFSDAYSNDSIIQILTNSELNGSVSGKINSETSLSDVIASGSPAALIGKKMMPFVSFKTNNNAVKTCYLRNAIIKYGVKKDGS